ncbi:MAG: hypothetical protein A2289_22320 [Deltaproteobacteria bacterium RIFOXYA12_FULL_58_15]|nr:MAG: hypothetical protein A2289_22320 [Deltaproteobacteria bacterium RIFOXYA12_FULL_58_15]
MARLGPGSFIANYQLLDSIGCGGAGQVFLARHIHPAYAEQPFAIKTLRAHRSREANDISRFRREAWVLSLLHHPNIIQTFEADVEADSLYIAMEYVDGRNLETVLERANGEPIPLDVALHITAEVLRGLEYAHGLKDSGDTPMGIVHLDVKPANILLSFDGAVKLSDFGIAAQRAQHASRDDTRMGTAGYTAPEVLCGEPIDCRADLFGVGVLLFEMVCGRPLFNKANTDDLLRENRRAEIPEPRGIRPDLPVEIENVILRALRRRPNGRFSSAKDMLNALAPSLADQSLMALGVSSHLRRIFCTERTERQNALAAHRHRGPSFVAVLTPDQGAQRIIDRLLRGKEIIALPCREPNELGLALRSPTPPGAVIVDCRAGTCNSKDVVDVLRESPRLSPTIALGTLLDARTIAEAAAINALDIVTEPFSEAHLVSATQLALAHAPKCRTEIGEDTFARAQLLIVSADPAMRLRLRDRLVAWGYAVDEVHGVEHAVARVRVASFHGIIVDSLDAGISHIAFVERVRNVPGIGMMPIISLANKNQQDKMPLRTAIRPRTDAPLVIISAFNQLRGAHHLGRTFIRYRSTLPAELACAGRTVPGEVVDIARGGILLATGTLPSVGTTVAITLHPPEQLPITMQGTVVRVELEASGSRAHVGIGFLPSQPDQQTRLVEFIGRLHVAMAEHDGVDPRRRGTERITK